MPSGKRIVCDTGPLLHLREAGLLDLLRFAGQVFIPPAVEAEAAELDEKWSLGRPEWIGVVPLQPPFDKQASDWLLTDDMAARLLANHQGQEVHGSLGVVLWAAAGGQLDRPGAEAALEALFRSSLWVSAQVMEEARAALRQLFS